MTIFLLVLFIMVGLLYIYYMVQSFKHCLPGKGWIVLFPFWLFMSQSFTEEGNKYRVRSLQVAGVLGLILAIIMFESA